MDLCCVYDYFLNIDDNEDEFLKQVVTSVKFQDFHIIREEKSETGEPLFLAEFNRKKNLYYIKELDLYSLEKQQIINEQRILKQLINCKQIICDSFFFFDEKFYIATQCISSTLRGHIEKTGYFNDRVIKLYIAQLMIVLQIIHQNFVVHCNIKPEFIYFDKNV